jgi:hypothetical protein
MSTPQNPRLKIPQSRHTTAFREIEQVLRSNPTLSKVVKTWKTWRGTANSNDRAGISVGLLPWVKLTPNVGPQSWATNRQQESQLNVQVEIATDGTCVDDPLDLWDAMRRALFPVDNDEGATMRQRLKDAGAHSGVVTLSQVPYDPTPEAEASDILVARGTITLNVRVDT